MLNITWKATVFILILQLFWILFFNFINYLTMFQQNGYYFKNYQTWIKSNLYKIIAKYFIFILIVLIINIFNVLILNIFLNLISILVLCFTIWFKIKLTKQKQRIKIKYTPRIKRLIATFILLLIIDFVLTLMFVFNFNIWIGIVIILILNNLFLPILILLTNLVNSPIEKTINKKYFNEAKKKVTDFTGEVIALSGSYGKTTTKNFVYTILSQNYFVYQTPASFNSTMGLTISIRKDLKPIHDIFLAELGAKQNKDLDDVMELTSPDLVILSSIGPQHLETFKTMENIINTKFAIVEKLQKNKLALLNYDNEYIKNYKIKNKDVKIITYGIENKDVNYQIRNIELTKEGSIFDVYYNGVIINKEKFKTKVLGKLNLLNICAGIGIAHQKKMKIEDILKGVLKITSPKNRLELKNQGNYIMIDDAYNSNPVGSKEALNVLKQFKGRKIVVTPGMIELGSKQKELNYKFGTYMLGSCDYVILVGQKISKDIYDGLKKSNFKMENVFVVNHINEAFSKLNTLCKNDQINYVLFENDLPDVYM